jgi:uncharacterized protein (TIGR03083 family)
MGVRALVGDERSDLGALLRSLKRAEWDTPSLCEGWRVRDVVAHLLYDTMSVPRYAVQAARSGFSPRRMNDRAVERFSRLDPEDLVDAFARSVHGGLIATITPGIALADVVVHHQDIRRPLNRPRSIPTARLLAVLDHPDPFASPRSRTRGLRFVATDIDWTRGDGPEVEGTAEAIMMAIAGRAIALDDLTGPGLDQLQHRIVASR